MKLFKIISLSLVLTMLVSVIGCAKTNTNSTNSTEETINSEDIASDESLGDTGESIDPATSDDTNQTVSTSGASVSTPVTIDMNALKGTTVTMLMWRDATADEVTRIAKFKSSTDITVKLVFTTQEQYMSKLASLITSNDAPDIAVIPTANDNQGCFPLGTLSVYQPIDVTGQKMDDPFWDKSVMDKFTIKGRYYAFASESNWYDCNNIVIYNSDLFKDNGIPTPRELWKSGKWTWESLKATALKIVSLGSTFTGYINDNEYALMQSMNTDYTTYDGKTFTSNVTSPAVTKVWTFNAQMIESGAQPAKGVATYTTFLKGNTGMFSTNLWQIRKESNTKGLDFAIDCVQFPSPEGSPEVIGANINLFGIAKKAKNPKGAGVFLKDFLNPANGPKFADAAVNTTMEDVFNYITSAKRTKGVKYACGVLGYTDISSLKRVNDLLPKTASNQISTVLQQNKSLFDNAVSKVNSKIA